MLEHGRYHQPDMLGYHLAMLRIGVEKNELNEIVSVLISRNFAYVSTSFADGFVGTYCQSEAFVDGLVAPRRLSQDIDPGSLPHQP